MEFSDRLSNLRQLIAPGARQPAEDERLLQLYWNRAELKKELARLQEERHKLLEQLRNHEATFIRHNEQLLQLEEFLGNPRAAIAAYEKALRITPQRREAQDAMAAARERYGR